MVVVGTQNRGDSVAVGWGTTPPGPSEDRYDFFFDLIETADFNQNVDDGLCWQSRDSAAKVLYAIDHIDRHYARKMLRFIREHAGSCRII